MAAPLSHIPLFGRGGSILLLGPEMEWADQLTADPLEIRVYRGADAVLALYEDDGETRGGTANTTILISCHEIAQRLTIGARRGDGSGGMLRERTFNTVVVREARGTGSREVLQPDAVIRYVGQEVAVTLRV